MGEKVITGRPGEVIQLQPGTTVTPYTPLTPVIPTVPTLPVNPFNTNQPRIYPVPRYQPPQTFNNLNGLAGAVNQAIIQPGNQAARERRRKASPVPTMAAAPAAPPQPSPLAQQLGADGMLERFFVNALDGHHPIYSPEKSVPSLVEKSVIGAVNAAHEANMDAYVHYGNREALDKRDARVKAERQARAIRSESDVARGILTLAREDYAHLVNEKKMRRKDAALYVIEHIKDADTANGNVIQRLMGGAFTEVDLAARAERAGTMPYKREESSIPYVIPKPEAYKIRYVTPEEARMGRVNVVRARIAADVNGMKQLARGHTTGDFKIPVGVQPTVVESWLTSISRDLEKDGILNTPRTSNNTSYMNFVPIDKGMLASMPKPVQDAVARVEKAFKDENHPPQVVETITPYTPGGTFPNEVLAQDLEIISGLLTGRANALTLMQGPARTGTASDASHPLQPPALPRKTANPAQGPRRTPAGGK